MTFSLALSDNDLLSRKFTTSDPESEPNILPRIPWNGKNPKIELAYQLPPNAPMVRCRHCRVTETKQANHRNGYVVRYDGGAGILVGKDCAAKHYKSEWRGIESRFGEERQRRRNLLRLKSIGDNWPSIDAELTEIVASPAFGIHDTAARKLRELLPDFHMLLMRSLGDDAGELYEVVSVRDYTAELRRSEGANSSDSQRPIYVEQRRSLGSIKGREFLSETGSIGEVFRRVHKQLNELMRVWRENSTGTLNTRDLTSRLRQISSHFAELNNLMNRLHALIDFLDPLNLKLLCEWASKQQMRGARDLYAFDGRNIARKASNTGRMLAKWPVHTFQIPAAPILRSIREV